MIHFFSVGKFVYYNIIQDFFRGEDQPPVEIQVSFAGAASPAGFLFPDRDTAVGYAHFSGVGCGFSFEYFSGGFHIITAAEFRKRRVFSLGLCRPGGRVGKVLQDPAFFLGEKTLDGGIWHCVRSTDSHLTGNADLDRQGFPATADNAVGKGMRYHKKTPFGQYRNLYTKQKSIYKKDSR